MTSVEHIAENLVLELQSGIRKWVFIAFCVSIILAYPSYLSAISLVNFWFTTSFNSNHFVAKNIVMSKVLTENELRLDTSNYVDLTNGKRLIYTFIDNRANRDLGYYPFIYKKQVTDRNNNLLVDNIETTYLLPGEAKYISAYTENQNAVAIKIEKQTSSKPTDYNPKAGVNIKNIELQIRDKSVFAKSNDKNTLTLRTSIKNPTSFMIKTVDLVMLIRDSQDSIIGVQNYSFNGLLPDEEREVIVDYPAPKNRTPKSLDVRYTINYLDESNIVANLKKE